MSILDRNQKDTMQDWALEKADIKEGRGNSNYENEVWVTPRFHKIRCERV